MESEIVNCGYKANKDSGLLAGHPMHILYEEEHCVDTFSEHPYPAYGGKKAYG